MLGNIPISSMNIDLNCPIILFCIQHVNAKIDFIGIYIYFFMFKYKYLKGICSEANKSVSSNQFSITQSTFSTYLGVCS